MLPDIENKEDIKRLIDIFYHEVRADGLIGPIFTDQVKVNWEKHLPVMYDFWDNVLFYSGSYTGNPMLIHQHLHARFPLTEVDFDRWLQIFNNTVNGLYAGPNANLIMQRALSIATVMKIKIFHTIPVK